MGSILIFIASLLLNAAHADEIRSCLEPAHPSPQIAYTLASFKAGTLDDACEASLKRAAEVGFTAVTLVPAKVFLGKSVVPDGTVGAEELTRCLDWIWGSGLDLIFQPHIESEALIHPSVPPVWRAELDLVPDRSYESLDFDPFFAWLGAHAREIRARQRRVLITIASELETSVTRYPAQWLALVQRLRSRLQSLGLDGVVPLGFDPNWWPQPAFTGTEANCRAFREFVSALDFVAPSFYGDWSAMMRHDGKTPRGRAQVDELKAGLIGRLSHDHRAGCEVPEMSGKRFSIGEFGAGGNFRHMEKGDLAAAGKPGFIPKRRAVYFNLLDWARSQADPDAYINVWTIGLFDPVGVTPGPDTIADPEIARLFREFRDWRCGAQSSLY